MCCQLTQGLRNIRFSIQAQLYKKQRALALKHNRSWAGYIMSLASALQTSSEESSDLIGLL